MEFATMVFAVVLSVSSSVLFQDQPWIDARYIDGRHGES